MHRIDTSTKAVDLHGAGKHGWKNGDKANGIAATDATAEWFNDFQENFCRFIESTGIPLVKGDYDQLRLAIQAVVVGAQKAVTISNATFEASVANGEVVRWDAGNNRFDEAVADGTANNRAVGVADVTNGKVYIFGECPLFTGLTPGSRYYLDGTTPGAVTVTAPADGVAIGLAKSAMTLYLDIDALGARLDQANVWLKSQIPTEVALAVTTGTFNPDFDYQDHAGQVTGNLTFGNGFTNAVTGRSGLITVRQNGATLYNWAFGSSWLYEGGASAIPAQTQTLGAYDEVIYRVRADGKISFKVRSDVKA